MRPKPILVVLCILAPSALTAWDEKGHRTAAGIAAKLLTANTRERVHRILATAAEPGATLVSISPWADLQRTNPVFPISNSSGHFMSIPLDVRDGDPNTYCPRGDCLWNSLQASLRALTGPSRTPEIRAMALKFAVHLVADLHQPLHCADNGDRGGNTLRLQISGTGARNFHALWDTHHGVYEPSVRELSLWRGGSLQDWLWESHNLAASAVYTPEIRAASQSSAPISISRRYLNAAESTASLQLAKAGVRLAHLLNQSFDATYKSPRNIAELLGANAAEPLSTKSTSPPPPSSTPAGPNQKQSAEPAPNSAVTSNYITFGLGGIIAVSVAAAYPIAVRRRRRVFISYRRKGTGGEAGRIADVLRRELGASRVFFDVDTIGAGEDFRRVILSEIHKADVVVVVMGVDWATMVDDAGSRRIMQDNDLVRREVAEALSAGIRVIPILVYGAVMPSEADLPPDLASLPSLNAIPIYHSQFEAGTTSLIAAIRKSPRRTSPAAPGGP